MGGAGSWQGEVVDKPLTLADAEHDLRLVETELPSLRQRLAEARNHTGPVLESIALANGTDPNAGVTAQLRAMAASCCDGIEYAVSEAEKHAQIVREHLAKNAARDVAAPSDIEASWKRFVGAYQHARSELAQLEAVL